MLLKQAADDDIEIVSGGALDIRAAELKVRHVHADFIQKAFPGFFIRQLVFFDEFAVGRGNGFEDFDRPFSPGRFFDLGDCGGKRLFIRRAERLLGSFYS